MKKLDMKTNNLTEDNIKKITKLFPNIVKEGVIDFDLLKQELSDVLVEGGEERYRLDWPGKRASILKANASINKTLRPVKKDSVDFENTENIYIEGDNFEVLKLLQESYLNKVKMIYIDPPYNTGTAMIYNNDFKQNKDEYDKESGVFNEEGGKLFKNTDTNGRFHSDWLSMMYERIVVSRDLLKANGFFVVAIDHNEISGLVNICDEIFSENNRLGIVAVVHKPEGRNQANFFGLSHEYMVVYAKDIDQCSFNKVALDDEISSLFDKVDDSGSYRLKNFIRLSDGKYSTRESKPHFYYPLYVSPDLKNISLEKQDGFCEVYPITDSKQERTWKTTKETFKERYNKGDIIAIEENDGKIKIFEKLREDQVIKTHWINKKYHGFHYGTKIVDSLLGIKTFDFPKSIFLMKDILKLMINKNDIILDFFSGSATTAHAVMQLNTEDRGNRKYIMVQLPEETDEKSEAYKAGYKTISDIGKERIRRAGKKIKEELKEKGRQLKIGEETIDPEKLDFGFRVYKTDSSNMKDVYYNPKDLKQNSLLDLANNIKEDRDPEDLLTQIILDLGLELSLKIEEEDILGNKVFFVASNSLVACFDEKINIKIVDEIAKIKPLKVVFCDAGFKDDKDRINIEERFKRLSPETHVNVI